MLSPFHLIVVALLFKGGLAYPLSCDSGPTYWCKDVQTAQECGMEEFCRIMAEEEKDGMPPVTVPPTAATGAPPVNVSLYYESLCPGCRAMIQTQIYRTYKTLKSTGIVDIQLFPYGNAYEHKRGQEWVFQCQHGEDECQVNMVETCALHLLPAVDRMEYIYCVETSPHPTVDSGKKCSQKLGLEWDPIFNCFNGSMGNFLEHQVAEATDALKPSHIYVPWITVNGVHTEAIQDKVTDNMLGYVCSVYTGPKPAACAGVEPLVSKKVEKCYVF